jgi:hypothetical protein
MSTIVVGRTPAGRLRDSARALSPAMVLGGAAVAAIAVIGMVAPDLASDYHLTSSGDYAVQALICASDVLALLAFTALHLAHAARPGYGRAGKAGAGLTIVGQLTIMTANLATLVTGGNPLAPLHAIGFLTLFPGMLLLARAMSRVRLLPRWAPVLFAASPLVLFAGPPGGVVFGASWILIGASLRTRAA